MGSAPSLPTAPVRGSGGGALSVVDARLYRAILGTLCPKLQLRLYIHIAVSGGLGADRAVLSGMGPPDSLQRREFNLWCQRSLYNRRLSIDGSDVLELVPALPTTQSRDVNDYSCHPAWLAPAYGQSKNVRGAYCYLYHSGTPGALPRVGRVVDMVAVVSTLNHSLPDRYMMVSLVQAAMGRFPGRGVHSLMPGFTYSVVGWQRHVARNLELWLTDAFRDCFSPAYPGCSRLHLPFPFDVHTGDAVNITNDLPFPRPLLPSSRVGHRRVGRPSGSLLSRPLGYPACLAGHHVLSWYWTSVVARPPGLLPVLGGGRRGRRLGRRARQKRARSPDAPG